MTPHAPFSLVLLPWAVTLMAALVGSVTDLRTGKIPNWLTLPLWAAGLGWAAVTSGWGGLLDSLGGSALLLVPFFLLFAFAGGGAGDAKLMAAIGAWLGLPESVTVLLSVTLSGALLGVALAIGRGQGRRMLSNVGRVFQALGMILMTRRLAGTWMQYAPDPATKMVPMRYGPAIFIGVAAAAIVLHW